MELTYSFADSLNSTANLGGVLELDVLSARQRPKDTGNLLGDLALAIAGKGDVFFSQDIFEALFKHAPEKQMGIETYTLGKGEQWLDGTQRKEFELIIEADNTVIEGYYEDRNVIQNKVQPPYAITIYLYYQT